MALARLKSVAGVTIPDTALCNAAVDLLESSSPGFLCTHCLRTYIFGSLAVRGLGRSVVDEEAAFCGAVLHDLGLVPPYRRDNRFEVDGADAARQFCSKHQVAPERADLVWKAIALHTSPGIATRLADEVALVHLGAGLELLGLGLDQVPPQVVEEVLERYPKMGAQTAGATDAGAQDSEEKTGRREGNWQASQEAATSASVNVVLGNVSVSSAV
jgi:hypothetical protein